MNTANAEWLVEFQVRGIWAPHGAEGSSLNEAQAAKLVRAYKRRGMTASARLGYVDYSDYEISLDR